MSVLTEPAYFDGSLDDLRDVRKATQLPLLRKDFIVDEYQVYESAAADADALLLIVAALNDSELRSLRELAEDKLGMDALVEVHDAEELDRALGLDAELVGINNRNLKTFVTDLHVTTRLAPTIPRHVHVVAESGLSAPADLRRLSDAHVTSFLVGESLMRQKDVAAATRLLLGNGFR